MKIIYVLFIALLIALIIPSCKKGSSTPPPTPDLTPDSLKVGLLAYYPFDNNANDVSGNGHTGTVVRAISTADRHGKANGAYSFNGYNSYVMVPGNTSLTLNNTNFTLSAWVSVYTYSVSTYMSILTRRWAGSDNGWILGMNAAATQNPGLVFFDVTGIAVADGNKIVDVYGWHMITVTYNFPAQQMSIYIDGQLDRVVNHIPSPNPPASANFYIGRDDPTTDSGTELFNGSIEEVRIYNRVLSANAIQKLYTF